MFRRVRLSAFHAILCAFPICVKAETVAELSKGYSFTVGAAAKQLDFDYYRFADDNQPAGSMTEGMYFTYLIRAASPYHISDNKKWGYYFETGYSNFSMAKQNVGGEERRLGTSVDGHFGYITPVGFYVIGPVPSDKREWSVLTGIGIGIGYLDARGNMILTEDGSNERVAVNQQGFDLAVSVLLEARYGKWVSRIVGGGPFLDAGQHTYSVFDFSWDFGYTFRF